jgi:uncharacterized protein (TIGR03086 family)
VDTSPLDQLARALDDTAALVRGVREDQWDGPTPCSEWDVRGVVQHLVVGHQVFARALRGDAVAAVPAEPPRAPLDAAYTGSAADMLEAFRAPGVLDGQVTVPFGTVPGTVALHLRLVDALVHGWDVAVATGQRPGHDERLAEQEIGFTRSFLTRIPPGRTPFAPSVQAGDDALALDRLAALLGRDTGWAASR